MAFDLPQTREVLQRCASHCLRGTIVITETARPAFAHGPWRAKPALMTNEQIRILVIEDNLALVRMIADMLSQSQGTVFFVDSAPRLMDGTQRLAAGGV